MVEQATEMTGSEIREVMLKLYENFTASFQLISQLEYNSLSWEKQYEL